MARPIRKNNVARWAVAIATGLATLGFWTGVISAPQPVGASASATQTVQSAPAPLQSQSRFGRQRSAVPSFSQPQVSAPMPRLRTRAS